MSATNRSARLLDSFEGRMLIGLLILDAIVIAVNFIGAPSWINLDEERNATTWYSSAKLLVTALAAIRCHMLEGPAERRGFKALIWPCLAILFLLLSLDETATMHEQVTAWFMQGDAGASLRSRLLGGDATKDAYAWPVVLAPVIVLTMYFLVSALYSRMRDDRRALLLGLAGCAAFAVAIGLESVVVYLTPPIVAWGDAEIERYSLFTRIEESAEVLGATFLLASLALHGAFVEARSRRSLN